MSFSRKWELNMDINPYKIVITPTAIKEINKIYDYIMYELKAQKAAKDLMRLVELQINKLKLQPKLCIEIEKIDDLKRRYRRMVVKNYVILYAIDEKKKVVFISHMYYGRANYLDL